MFFQRFWNVVFVQFSQWFEIGCPLGFMCILSWFLLLHIPKFILIGAVLNCKLNLSDFYLSLIVITSSLFRKMKNLVKDNQQFWKLPGHEALPGHEVEEMEYFAISLKLGRNSFYAQNPNIVKLGDAREFECSRSCWGGLSTSWVKAIKFICVANDMEAFWRSWKSIDWTVKRSHEFHALIECFVLVLWSS